VRKETSAQIRFNVKWVSAIVDTRLQNAALIFLRDNLGLLARGWLRRDNAVRARSVMDDEVRSILHHSGRAPR